MPDATPTLQGAIDYPVISSLRHMLRQWNTETLQAAAVMLKDELKKSSGKLKPWHHRCYACGNPRMVWLRKSSLWHCYACGVEEEAEEKIVAVVTMEK